MMSERSGEETAQRGETLVELDELRTYYPGGGLFKDRPVKAVDGVSLDIQRGETLGLVGESGCGKTTLGRTLVRLEEATGGTVSYDGTDITSLRGRDLKEWRRNTQMMFQDPDSSLNDRMTVGEIVREPLDVHDIGTARERREQVRELLDTVGLQPEHYYRYPHQFSGGQRQRIGIARALALEPDFIVLDEPVSALDVSVQAKILNLLDDLQEEFGLTYLLIAHDLSVVRHICDRVAVMYLGNIVELGPTETLFENPQNPYTYSLLSAIPEPDPTSESTRITLRGTPPNPRDPPQGCPFSTRCPVKIKPEAHRGLDDELWERIEEFRAVVRERDRADRSLREILREKLGMETRYSDVTEMMDELFGELEVPDGVATHLRTAAEHIEDNEAERAREYLFEEFGSACDREEPEFHTVGDGSRQSYCHRHLDEYDSPRDRFDTIV
jgi:peptide/nickel transport system ATP-binding protein